MYCLGVMVNSNPLNFFTGSTVVRPALIHISLVKVSSLNVRFQTVLDFTVDSFLATTDCYFRFLNEHTCVKCYV